MLLASQALAQAPLITGKLITGYKDTNNVRLMVMVSGYAANQYVSGTDQGFAVTVTIGAIPGWQGSNAFTSWWLTSVTITIGDQSVESWSNSNTAIAGETFYVTWDTTNFPMDPDGNGVSKKIEVIAKGKASSPAQGTVDVNSVTLDVPVTIYNVAFCAEIPYATAHYPTASQVGSTLFSINYAENAIAAEKASDCLPPAVPPTVYYFDGHGYSSPSEFGDSLTNQPAPPPPPWWILSSDVASKCGIGAPPVSFALLNACQTGSNDAMYTAFCAPTDPAPVDRSEIGWTCDTYFDWDPPFAQNFFQHLADGYTVQDCAVYGFKQLQKAKLADGPAQDGIYSDYMTIYGDALTTLHFVYTHGNPEPSTNWYIVTNAP